MFMFRISAFIIALFLAGVPSLGIHPALAQETEDTLPRLVWSEIPAEIAPDEGTVQFGYLEVPESRRDQESTRTIQLAVAIVKCRGDTPKPDPLLYSTGGPGVLSTVRAARHAHKVDFIKEVLKDRDFILFEQRGARYAKPALLGPEIDAVYQERVGKHLNNRSDSEQLRAAAEKLRDRLLDEGVNLGAYRSMESAADIADLRKALEIKELNLYGISYSCRLMLEVIRRFPEGIRSVILDSPLPPDANWDETSVENFWQAMQALFKRCREDKAVDEKYPDLENRFLKLLDEANKNPLTAVVQHPKTKKAMEIALDAKGIVQCVYDYIANSQYIYSFAYSMNMLCDKNPQLLGFLANTLTAPPDYAWGMRFSFWCNEELPFEDLSKIRRRENVPGPLKDMTIAVVPEEVYSIWPSREPDPVENQPVHSSLPVMIFSGEFDPDIPPDFGRRVAKTLPHAFHIVFPGQSHLPTFGHPGSVRIIRKFLDRPEKKPSVRHLYRPAFKFYVEP